MGQSPSSAASPHYSDADPDPDFYPYPIISPPPPTPATTIDDLPDDLLAHVFHYIPSPSRSPLSLVCRRFLHVDSLHRTRLSLPSPPSPDLLSLLPRRFPSLTSLTLRSSSSSPFSDETLILLSLHFPRLVRLKLRSCRAVSDRGMSAAAANLGSLKKFSCSSCTFGVRGIDAVLRHCHGLEELSVKRLRIYEGNERVGEEGMAFPQLKKICLKELIFGQCFRDLLVKAIGLTSLKVVRCIGDWDDIICDVARANNQKLSEIHLEKIQISDVGISSMSRCKGIESLFLVKIPECTNSGISQVVEGCRGLRKIHLDGWRINRIGDDALVAISSHSERLQELVLIGVNATSVGLGAVSSRCKQLERLAFCGSDTIGDDVLACVASKCSGLRKLCIKNCPVSDTGIEALALGCPNLVKVKVRKCQGVSGRGVEWLKEKRKHLVLNLDSEGVDAMEEDDIIRGSESEFPQMHGRSFAANDMGAGNERLTSLRGRLGSLAGRSWIMYPWRRWEYMDGNPSGNL
ncbi:hypothetical protein MLD38_028567 [Melastoma candidum]|uniref:Uncharacterized protein n=1 Tax=Melastoma candidum TaxID=119954 RepID=A0ACB9N150_9MYRT|nr:hypothetical protein MLD38_028567 [Melastoma candidum]